MAKTKAKTTTQAKTTSQVKEQPVKETKAKEPKPIKLNDLGYPCGVRHDSERARIEYMQQRAEILHEQLFASKPSKTKVESLGGKIQDWAGKQDHFLYKKALTAWKATNGWIKSHDAKPRTSAPEPKEKK